MRNGRGALWGADWKGLGFVRVCVIIGPLAWACHVAREPLELARYSNELKSELGSLRKYIEPSELGTSRAS